MFFTQKGGCQATDSLSVATTWIQAAAHVLTLGEVPVEYFELKMKGERCRCRQCLIVGDGEVAVDPSQLGQADLRRDLDAIEPHWTQNESER